MPVITHNLLSQYTNRQLNITTGKKASSAEKLSSGYRINRSADDAAGLQISEKMRWQLKGLNYSYPLLMPLQKAWKSQTHSWMSWIMIVQTHLSPD